MDTITLLKKFELELGPNTDPNKFIPIDMQLDEILFCNFKLKRVIIQNSVIELNLGTEGVRIEREKIERIKFIKRRVADELC